MTARSWARSSGAGGGTSFRASQLEGGASALRRFCLRRLLRLPWFQCWFFLFCALLLLLLAVD